MSGRRAVTALSFSFAAFSFSLFGCSAEKAMGGPDMAEPAPIEIAAEPQRGGDPAAGYDDLVNRGYVTCGVPYSLYTRFFGAAPDEQRLPGRTGHNAELPYGQTALVTASGVEVVSANCLTCHAGSIDGQLVVGLGAADGDFTNNVSNMAEVAGYLITDAKEKAEWRRWADRVEAIAPYTQTAVVGVNPGDNLAAVLFAHRDPATLAWSATPLLDLPPPLVVPVDVPPWWRMKKKNAMFYDAAGRGDHTRIMVTTSTLCTDNRDEAASIDAYFNDVRAFIISIQPPAWKWSVDATLAQQGRRVYQMACQRCHGIDDRFPNLVISLDDVGTDAVLALGASQFADRFVDWFSKSFYGETARLEPQRGYMAPPLDGIWATAPYLHNGSVPTMAALLDSTLRPKYWTRTFDSRDYDQATLGWHFTAVDHGQADESDATKKVRIYDTTMLGYGNGGHTYGDSLSPADRAALLEYLKTI
jgi:mono/diheme cytochrome c family protein